MKNAFIAFLVLALFFIFTSKACAEIAYNGVSTTSGTDSSFTQEYTHSGTNGFLIVVVNFIPDNDQYVGLVTYNGVALINEIFVQTRNDSRTDVWYLINPPVGAYDVVVNLTGSAKTIVDIVSLTGVHQTEPIYFWTNVSGTQVTSLYTTIQEQTGNSIFGLGCTDSLAQTYPLPGQIILWNETYNSEMRTQAVYATSTQTGTVVVPNYLDQVCNWAAIFFNIKAAE